MTTNTYLFMGCIPESGLNQFSFNRPNSTCENLPDLPVGLAGATGQLFQGKEVNYRSFSLLAEFSTEIRNRMVQFLD